MPNSKAKLRVFSVFIYIFLLFGFAKQSSAQSLPFSDNFESGISSNWQTIHGTWYTAVDPNYPSYGNWLVANAPSASDFEIQTGNFSWTNYQLSFDILPKTNMGIDRNIFFRVNDQRTSILQNHDLPVSYSLQLTQGLSYLGKWTTTSMPPLPTSTFSIPLDVVSHLTVRLENSNIKVLVNGSQILDYTDNNNPILSGRVAFATITGASPAQVWYDNILITALPTATPTPLPTSTPTPTPSPSLTPTPSPSPTPIPFPSLDVPDIKQYDSQWKNLIYDTATKWSSNPTIERWGCALTSASMILNYYGHNILPGALNSWLKNQSDGYLRNGLVNWLAISRYSKQNSGGILPTLEYRRLGNAQDLLINELKDGRPAILQEPGHFIVAKSQTETSFGINDPGYSNRSTLASYGDTFSAIGSYVPTHTNLSYIMLTADKDSTIAIFDSSGNPVSSATTYLQEPLTEDPDNTNTSGETLKVLLLPKPDLEKYSVHVDNGQNPLSLDVYAYDNNGNLLTNEPEIINATGSAVFQLNYDSDPTTPLLDNTPPEVTGNITPGSNAAGWNNSDVTVTWNLSDPESSIISKSGCDPTTIVIETAGTVLTCTASSIGGIATKSVTVKLNKTNPTASVSYSTLAPTKGNVIATIHPSKEVTITNNSGSDFYTFNKNGSFMFNFTDIAGNNGSALATVNNIDTLPPTVPVHVSPENNSFFTTSTLTVIDWENSTDENGPIKYIYQSANSLSLNPDGSFSSPVYTSAALTNSQISTLGTPAGIYFWHIKAVDSLGNESAWSEPWKVTVDNTPPTISLNVSPTPNSDGWNNSDTTISWNTNDPESPIITKSGCNTIIINTETTSTTITCTASSVGGTTSKSVTVKLDKTAPKITISKPLNNANYVLNANVMGSWTITDSLSKLKGTKTAKTSSKSLLDTSYVGKHIFTLNAKDSADNLTTVNLDYYVAYAFKFLSPKTIIRKQFLTTPFIPVKFKLNDAKGKFLPYVQAKVWIAETNTPLFGGVNPSGYEYEYMLPTQLLPVTKNASLNVVISLDDGFVYTQKITLK